jgi:hypothetical protein
VFDFTKNHTQRVDSRFMAGIKSVRFYGFYSGFPVIKPVLNKLFNLAIR